ncbi:MAG: hypothetical protein JWM37_828 [Candidatus Saccharibacteria bacterium]|nr:hypothetical protein [Candidatus Saccharibacteria bacterium]
MRAINHALTGAVIGLSLPAPVAIPLAFVSHFVLDAIPHQGSEAMVPKNKIFTVTLIVDAILCVLLVLVLGLTSTDNWFIPSLCAFLGTSPDLMWLNNYRQMKQGKPQPHTDNWLLRFHSWIQWYERPLGLITEVVWAPAMIMLMIARI